MCRRWTTTRGTWRICSIRSGSRRAVIGGLSLGGYVAFALFRRAPERFRALVLADTRAEADAAEARASRTRLIALAGTDGIGAIADDFAPKLLGTTTKETNPGLLERVRQIITTNQASAVQAALAAMMRREDSTALLPAITVPTLVIVGDEDQLTPPALSASMRAALPRASLVVIPKAGHLPNLEQPEAFNAALLTFLGGL
ncbi:MAG: alpha/beta fold hydrolase [Vicinamibacterales bacterium]